MPLKIQIITAPTKAPTIEIWKKSIVASFKENIPVTVAATPYLKQIKPDASLIKLSPLIKCINLSGICAFLAIDWTAIGSVGDKTATNVKAVAQGKLGISHLTNTPPTKVKIITKTIAFPKIGPFNFHSSRLGKLFPSLNRIGAINTNKNHSVST